MPSVGLAALDGRLGDVIMIEDNGPVTRCDTSAYSLDAVLYCSPTVAGACTATRPVLPAFAQACGHVMLVHASAGVIMVEMRISPPALFTAAEFMGGGFVGQAKWADF